MRFSSWISFYYPCLHNLCLGSVCTFPSDMLWKTHWLPLTLCLCLLVLDKISSPLVRPGSWISFAHSIISCVSCLTFLLCLCPLPVLQQTSNVSATLVLSRPIKGPKELVLDLEMVTVNNVINFRGSSIIRLTIFVSEHPFWGLTPVPQCVSRSSTVPTSGQKQKQRKENHSLCCCAPLQLM